MKKNEQAVLTESSRMQTVLQMLAHIANDDGLDMTQITALTGCLRRVVFRMLSDAKRDLRVQVEYSRGSGRYHLHDWGVLDGAKVVAQYRKAPLVKEAGRSVRKQQKASA